MDASKIGNATPAVPPVVVRLADAERWKAMFGFSPAAAKEWATKFGFPLRTRTHGPGSRPYVIVAEAIRWFSKADLWRGEIEADESGEE